MKLDLDRFLLDWPDQGRLKRTATVHPSNASGAWTATVNSACLIGPLTVWAAPGPRLHALDLEDGKVIPDFASGPRFAQTWNQFKVEAGSLRRGCFLALHGYRSYNFWHWTMESLVKLVLAQLAGFEGYVIVPPDLPQTRFVLESLSMLGLEQERVLPYDGKAWWLEQLFVVKPIDGYYSLRRYPGLLMELRRRMLAGAEYFQGPVRLYISREQASEGRRVTNENELLQVLGRFGFHKVVMEKLSLRQQVGLAAKAQCLLGPHGAGMTHSLFMPSGSLVLEMFSNAYVNPCILPIADILQHRYYMYPSANIKSGESDDIHALVYALELTLRRELELPAASGAIQCNPLIFSPGSTGPDRPLSQLPCC